MVRSLSFRTRILLTLLGLILAVQGTAFIAVYFATGRSARTQIEQELGASARVFEALMERREAELAQAASLVSGDFAFKTAFSLRHVPTMVTALRNLRNRIGADEAALLDLDHTLLAADPEMQASSERTTLPHLIEVAERSASITASGVDFVGERPYLLVTVPLKAPVPVAWITLGFDLNDALDAELKQLTGAEVSIRRREGSEFRVYASTLSAERRNELSQQPAHGAWERGSLSSLTIGGEPYVTLISPLGNFTRSSLEVVLQRPLNEAMESYAQLRLFLGLLTAAGLLISALGAGLIARNVTLPIRRVVAAVEKVAAGDYSVTVGVHRRDELGQLAVAVNQMTQGLAERDRARELLGKMVSQQVATELLGRRLELGGEQRVVTVLFADIRGFTRMSEHLPPTELVSVLNAYLTAISNVVEKHGGIIDKYMGDSVMAVFGAPIPQADHAQRAVRAALSMHRSLDELNRGLAERGRPRIEFGIGINSAAVVLGNMGSTRRLNYTVIGDGVNIAARVEKLTASTRSRSSSPPAPRQRHRDSCSARSIACACVAATNRCASTNHWARPLRSRRKACSASSGGTMPCAATAAATGPGRTQSWRRFRRASRTPPSTPTTAPGSRRFALRRPAPGGTAPSTPPACSARYSTRVARSRTAAGIVMPWSRAVFTLTTSPTAPFCIGISPGLPPLRIAPTISPARR